MGFTVTARGNGQDKTAATTYGFSPASNCTAGKLILLRLAADNAGTSGATVISGGSGATVTDTKGNTWSIVDAQNRTAASAANDGASCAFWSTTQNGGALTTSDTITVTFAGGTSVTAKAYILSEITVADAAALIIKSDSTGKSSTGTAFTFTSSSVPVGHLIVFGIALEDPSSGADDADTTNGSWSAGVANNTIGGGAATNIGIRGQHKEVTATATQTWNFTVANTDWASVYVTYEERTSPAPTLGSATAAASTASTSLQPNGGLASAPATSSAPSASIKPNLGLATATAAAYQPSVTAAHAVAVGSAAAAATASAPTASVAPSVGLATGTASAYNPVDADTPNPGVAASTATGLAPTVSIKPTAGIAAATASGLAPTSWVEPNVGSAAATASAFAPTVTTTSSTSVAVGLASATASAYDVAFAASPTLTPTVTPAGGSRYPDYEEEHRMRLLREDDELMVLT